MFDSSSFCATLPHENVSFVRVSYIYTLLFLLCNITESKQVVVSEQKPE